MRISATWRSVLVLEERYYGPDHVEVAVTPTNLGLIEVLNKVKTKARRTNKHTVWIMSLRDLRLLSV